MNRLERNSLLRLLLVAELEMLAAFDSHLRLVFAGITFQPQHNLLCSLGLLLKHGFGLPAKPCLLPIVPSLPLRKKGVLALLVLRHLVQSVLLALLPRTESLPSFRNGHLEQQTER
uniref:Secreted protein n=1 Tax=Rhodosorus marinus TaxID=101924 RepID=A0A7S3A1Q2_9RHOD